MSISEAIILYTKYRVSLGCKFRIKGFILNAFAEYVGKETCLQDIKVEQCTSYLYKKGCKNDSVTIYWFTIHTVLKGFFGWCVERGLLNSVPLSSLTPKKPLAYIPYIYSDKELASIFKNALTYRTHFVILYPEMVQAILKTIYFLGLRPSEAIRLSVSDIHLHDGKYALIRETKFYKSRIVPFNSQVAMMFSSLMNWRCKQGIHLCPESPLFVDKRGNSYKLDSIQRAFRLICNAAGIHRSDRETFHSDVRLTDLRHTFATNRITTWYKEGRDVQAMLPLLSTYLGHDNLNSTAVYISFTSELLQEASKKFELYHKSNKV